MTFRKTILIGWLTLVMAFGMNGFTAARETVEGLLGPTPLPVDELIRQCQLSPSIVNQVLVELELAGRIERQPGNRVSLVSDPLGRQD